MYPHGTCNGVQDTAEVRIRAVLTSRPFALGNSGAGSDTKRFGPAAPNPLAHSPLRRQDKRKPVSAAPVPHSGDVSIIGSRHCYYLPFLFQTARVEVGPLVKED
jgi:hypothetical protein